MARWHVGVDEAGKGPVLGSMFAAAVRVPSPGALPDGVDDSKRLSPARREELDAALRADPSVAVGVAEVTSDRIDDPRTDMNSLTVAAQARALGAVADGGERVFADASDTDASRFADRLASLAPVEADVAAEHGADGAHAVVGAASIVAKVARDDHVAALAAEHDDLVAAYGDLGSGYPADGTTRAFLEAHVEDTGDLPPFARVSWRTCRRLLDERGRRGLGEF